MLKRLCREGSEYSIFLALFFTEVVEFISKSMDFFFERYESCFDTSEPILHTSEPIVEGCEFFYDECLEFRVCHTGKKDYMIFLWQYIRILLKINHPTVRVLEEDLTVSVDHIR